MRAWIIGLAMLAWPAWAQQAPVLDGKATLSGPVAEMLAVSAQPLSKEAVRGLITAYINGQTQTAEDKDFFSELASGLAVDVTTPAKLIRIAPLAPEPLHTVKLLTSPPNLNTLWKQPGEPARDLLEVARWGERGRGRIVQFMANTLYGAWKRSAVTNGYKAWMEEYPRAYGAFESTAYDAAKGTVDAEMLKQAKLLLKDAMVQLFAKCKADGREPPPLFLYDLPLQSVGTPTP